MTEQLRVLRHEREKSNKHQEYERAILPRWRIRRKKNAAANLGPRNLTRTWVVVVVVVGIWFFLPCVLVYTQTFFILQSNPLGERMSYVQLVSFVFVI